MAVSGPHTGSPYKLTPARVIHNSFNIGFGDVADVLPDVAVVDDGQVVARTAMWVRHADGETHYYLLDDEQRRNVAAMASSGIVTARRLPEGLE